MNTFNRIVLLTALLVGLCMSAVQAAEYEKSITVDAYSQADAPAVGADVESTVASTVAGEMPAQFDSGVPSATESRLDRETFESVPEKTLVAPGICIRDRLHLCVKPETDLDKALLQETDTVDFT